MNRKVTFGFAVTLAIMFATVTFIMTMIFAQKLFDGRVLNIKERETLYNKLSEVDRLIRQNYYHDIDEEILRESLVQGYIKGISDPYGMYMTAEQYAQIMNDYEGRMVDIGVVCSSDAAGFIHIDEVYPESPAFVSGLEPGDLIVRVDEVDVTADDYETAVESLRGEPGTTVTLLVRRAGMEKEYPITRRRVEVPTVTSRMIEQTGYIRIREFNNNTPDQFIRILDELMNQGAQALLFDVRGNPGGTVEAVAHMLDRLLPEGPIVSSTDRDGQAKVLYTSDEVEVDLPMVVLINGKSASAAELFAQSLKDYQKAKTVGVTTFGKGSMQNIYKLSDGSALEITVALYNPPKSPNYEGVGVKPDYEVRLTADQEAVVDSLDEHSDPQLKKALEIIAATLRNLASPEPDVVVVPPQIVFPADLAE